MQEHSLSLPQKVERSKDRLQRVASENEASAVRVAWTGGKDSTVVLWLWRTVMGELLAQTDPSVQALRVDTGLEFPEIREFCQQVRTQWNVAETLAQAEPSRIPAEPGKDPVACCGELKIRPLREAVLSGGVQVLVTGLRQDEHPGRSGRSVFETREDPQYLQVNPILEWTEMDVWSFILAESLPYCSLYEQGYRSLDCQPCTERSRMTERGGRNRAKESQIEHLRSLGYF